MSPLFVVWTPAVQSTGTTQISTIQKIGTSQQKPQDSAGSPQKILWNVSLWEVKRWSMKISAAMSIQKVMAHCLWASMRFLSSEYSHGCSQLTKATPLAQVSSQKNMTYLLTRQLLGKHQLSLQSNQKLPL